LITEDQYQSLCKACDTVLTAEQPCNENSVAISWLHVIREHPVFLQTYRHLFEQQRDGEVPQPPDTSPPVAALKESRIGRIIRRIRALPRSGKEYWILRGQPADTTDLLIVSHLLNDNQLGKESDFYFGDIPQQVTAMGFNTAVALINHTTQTEIPENTWQDTVVPRFMLSRSLSWWKELGLLIRSRNEAKRLLRSAEQERDVFLQSIYKGAAGAAAAGGMMFNLRVGLQIEQLVRELRPRAILVTYEGHAWERLAFAAARKAVPSILCGGYQHAALFRLQHAALRPLGFPYDPDHIFCAGQWGYEQIKTHADKLGASVATIGSERAAATDASVASLHKKSRTCLVIPEGIASECELMFSFSLECAELFPEIHFIWRLHPAMSFEQLAVYRNNGGKLPDNITLSKAPLDQDIHEASWVLYRGSTAVVQAICGHAQPLYLRMENEMIIDPVHQMKHWKTVIANSEQFKQAIAQNLHQEEERELAVRFCRSFYLPLNTAPLISWISSN
jgi:hypothetical protein